MIKLLAKVWCPLKGLKCKEMGDNKFMFTFLQAAGKRKALEDGPWMVGKELIVMEDFDPIKTLDDYEFKSFLFG